MRNVKRQKVASASLFDQRRMRIQNSNNRNVNNSSNGITASKNVKYSAILHNKNSMDGMDTIELTEGHPTPRTGKIPKSPAPDIKLMEMV